MPVRGLILCAGKEKTPSGSFWLLVCGLSPPVLREPQETPVFLRRESCEVRGWETPDLGAAFWVAVPKAGGRGWLAWMQRLHCMQSSVDLLMKGDRPALIR